MGCGQTSLLMTRPCHRRHPRPPRHLRHHRRRHSRHRSRNGRRPCHRRRPRRLPIQGRRQSHPLHRPRRHCRVTHRSNASTGRSKTRLAVPRVKWVGRPTFSRPCSTASAHPPSVGHCPTDPKIRGRAGPAVADALSAFLAIVAATISWRFLLLGTMSSGGTSEGQHRGRNSNISTRPVLSRT